MIQAFARLNLVPEVVLQELYSLRRVVSLLLEHLFLPTSSWNHWPQPNSQWIGVRCWSALQLRNERGVASSVAGYYQITTQKSENLLYEIPKKQIHTWGRSRRVQREFSTQYRHPTFGFYPKVDICRTLRNPLYEWHSWSAPWILPSIPTAIYIRPALVKSRVS